MRSVTQIKSLGDIRTIISTHSRSTPRHKGTTYLEILSLGMEKLRLEAEMDWISRRQDRIKLRMGELRKDMDERLSQTKDELREDMDEHLSQMKEDLAVSPNTSIPDRCDKTQRDISPDTGKWKTMAFDY